MSLFHENWNEWINNSKFLVLVKCNTHCTSRFKFCHTIALRRSGLLFVCKAHLVSLIFLCGRGRAGMIVKIRSAYEPGQNLSRFQEYEVNRSFSKSPETFESIKPLQNLEPLNYRAV